MIRMEMKTEILPAKGEGIAKAAALLQRGELVALPTETVYGIAAWRSARRGNGLSQLRMLPLLAISSALKSEKISGCLTK